MPQTKKKAEPEPEELSPRLRKMMLESSRRMLRHVKDHPILDKEAQAREVEFWRGRVQKYA